MSKQRPDFDKIANELHGKSAFFQRHATPESPPEPAPEEQTPQKTPIDTKPAPEAAATPPPVRPIRPVRRQMIRHPFELYMDQLDRLRILAENQRRRGEPGSMSKMVRDAIDRLLNDQPTPD